MALWPAIACTIGLWLPVIAEQLPGAFGFMTMLALILAIPAGAILILGIAVYFTATSRPKRAASVALAVLLPVLLWAPMNWSAEYVHLALTVGLGVGQNGYGSPSHRREFVIYDWSVGFAGGPATFLIYDPTDEIALPLRLHKQSVASEIGFGEDCAGKVRRLLAHYYVCTF